MAARDLLHRAAEQDHRVGRGEGGHRGKRDLGLARAELDFERAQGQAQAGEVFLQDAQHRVELVVLVLAQELVAGREQLHLGRIAGLPGVGRRGVLPRDPEDVELDFQPHDQLLIAQPLHRFLQEPASVVGDGPAVLEIQIAQHPAGVGRPGQDAEGGRIGHHQHVARALELGHADAAARREGREDRAMRGVLKQQGAGEADARLQRRFDLRHGERLAAQHAVLVREREAEELQAVELQAAH